MIECNNHANTIANNLCVKCGKWYCKECMEAFIPEPICRICAGTKGIQVANLNTLTVYLNKLPFFLTVLPLFVLALVFSILTIVFHYLFLIPLLFVIAVSFVVGKQRYKQKSKKGKTKVITSAQIDTLLKITNNHLTIKELSNKTQASLDIAEKKLKELYLDGKLEMEESEGVIFYYKPKELT